MHLKGVVKLNYGGPLAGGCRISSFFQLPAGYRPGAVEIRPSFRNGVLTRIDIRPDGWVMYCGDATVNPGDWFVLDSISFRAAA